MTPSPFRPPLRTPSFPALHVPAVRVPAVRVPAVRVLVRPAVRAALLVAFALGLAACGRPADRFGEAGGAAPGLGAAGDAAQAAFAERVGDRVLFAVDQSSLSPVARNTLAAQARYLAENPALTATIEGHTDEQGTREYNLALGARRAASVQEFLVAAGVAPDRLRTVSYGKERPVEVCSDESCYAQNRRAVTVVAGGGAGF